MPHVYILRCADDSYYVGSARDLSHRIDQHMSGRGSAYTAKRQPVELVFAHETPTIDAAYAFEKQIQGWSRRKREALIRGEWHLLPSLSRRGGPAEG